MGWAIETSGQAANPDTGCQGSGGGPDKELLFDTTSHLTEDHTARLYTLLKGLRNLETHCMDIPHSIPSRILQNALFWQTAKTQVSRIRPIFRSHAYTSNNRECPSQLYQLCDRAFCWSGWSSSRLCGSGRVSQ